MQKPDDMLILEIKDGSLEAFDQLMQNHQGEVYRVAYGYTKNSDSALDISQNVFLKAYENLNAFKGSSTFRTWLIRITSNESMNWIRKHKRHQMHEGVEEMEIRAEDMTGNDLESSENKLALLRSLYDLNTRYRLAVILRYFENYSIREIASILNCSEGVVKNMLFRSLQKMKQILGKTGIGEVQ